MKKVVVIIPTYNEKQNIANLIPKLQEDVFPKIKDYSLSILVADDKSPDDTADEVRRLMKKWKNIDLISGDKLGLGAAYVRGMEYAVNKMDADIVFEMDADGQHDHTKIPDFLEKISAGYDMVIGTRYSGGGSIPENWPIIRKVYSIFGNLLVRFILGRFSIHDWTGGFRALKKEVFIKEKSELTRFRGYTFQVSFLHKAVRDGFKIAEVPFAFTDRTLGDSKIAPKEYIYDLLSYVIKSRFVEVMRSSFPKFLVVGGGGFLINFFLYEFLVRSTHLPIALANIFAAQFAIFSNFNLNNLWTFNSRRSKTVGSYFFKMFKFFLTSNTGVILIQSGIILLGDVLFGEELYRIYFLVGTFFLLIWNFTIYNKFIWRKNI